MKTYDELLAERDALLAQVDLLRKALREQLNDCINFDSGNLTGEIMMNSSKLLAATPQQCLAEIKAKEAVKGWWACWEWVDSDDKDKPTLIPAINQYEAKVRQGEQSGTWLKDSNVNGGKRQGGE